jgi:hypothetical protein
MDADFYSLPARQSAQKVHAFQQGRPGYVERGNMGTHAIKCSAYLLFRPERFLLLRFFPHFGAVTQPVIGR